MSAYRIGQVVRLVTGPYSGQVCKIVAYEELRELAVKLTGERRVVMCTPARMEDGRKLWVPTAHLAPLHPPKRRPIAPGAWHWCYWKPEHMR